MSSRFEVSDEPSYSNGYSWRLSDKPDKVDTVQQSFSKRASYDGSQGKVVFSNSAPLARSVDLFSSSVGYDINSNGIDRINGRPMTPGFDSTGTHEYVSAQGLSRAATPSGNRKSNSEVTRSIDLGSHSSLPSTSYNYHNSRSETAVASEGYDRLKNRPPVAPGRPKPQSSDTLPRSGTPATYRSTERNSSSYNNKRALHSSSNSLDNLRHNDQQQLYDKRDTVRTSSTNLILERKGSRNSDAEPFSHIQLGSSLRAPEVRDSSANAFKSLLSGSRSQSALAGSLERSGTPVLARSFAGTPDLDTRDKSSSLRHSTDLNLGTSYDEIVKRLRKMETGTNSGHYRMKPEIDTGYKELEPETRYSNVYAANNVSKKKFTDDYSTKKKASDEFDDANVLKDSSAYDRNSARSKDQIQYTNWRKPHINGNAADTSNKPETYLDLSNRTGERTSAYSQNGAIESWLRSVTTESSDAFAEPLHNDKSSFKNSNFSSGDHMFNDVSYKQMRSTKLNDTSDGYDEKTRNERSRRLSNDSHQRATSPVRQTVAKSSMVDSMYDIENPAPATQRGLSLAKQERDLSSYYPKTRPDSRLTLLRKYLDQADHIGTQAVSSAVDNGYLKLPDELGMDELRRSSSAIGHKNSSHVNGPKSRKISLDYSYLGSSQKPVYTTTTLARTPSMEAFNKKDLYSGISLSWDKPNSYQKSSYDKRSENLTIENERIFNDSDEYGFKAPTSSTERPRSPTRSFGETFTDRGGHDKTDHNSELHIRRLESKFETETKRKNNDFTSASIDDDRTPSQDWMSRSYGKPSLDDAETAEEKKKHDLIGYQLTGGYADSRTLLKILENNRKHKTGSTADANQRLEAKYSTRTSAELAKLRDNSGTHTTTNVSRSSKDQTRIESELSRVRSGSDFSSLQPPKRVWYSEEHLAPSISDADNDISVRFDYKPDTYRYVLRKDAVDSSVYKTPVSKEIQKRSAAALGDRKWRSDLALFDDNLESRDPQSTTFDNRDGALSVLRSSSFRASRGSETPDRRQVKWQDEVPSAKESGGSSSAINGSIMLEDDMISRKQGSVSPTAIFFKRSFDRPTERTSIADDSTGPREYQNLRSQSPSSKSFLAPTWSSSSVDETRRKQTLNGDTKSTFRHETSSNYRPSSSLYENPRSQSPASKDFAASTWSSSGRDEDRETRLKQIMSDYSNHNSLHTAAPNYRSSSSLNENLRSQSPSSKRILASTWTASDIDKDRETKPEYKMNGNSKPTSFIETSSSYQPSSSYLENLRSQSPSSKSFLASTWSSSGGTAEQTETKLKQAVNGDSISLQETPSNYRPSYKHNSHLSSTSYPYNDQDPLTTKASNSSLYNYDSTLATDQSKRPTSNDSIYKRPTDDGRSTKTSTHRSTDSIYKSSYSPARYSSADLSSPPDSSSNHITNRYDTPNSVPDNERDSSPYSSLRITEFLANRSAKKSTTDSSLPDGVLQEKWRTPTSNAVSTSGVSDDYHHLLSSFIYPRSTHGDSNHLTPASVIDSSTKEFILSSSSIPHRTNKSYEPLHVHVATNYPQDIGHLTTSLLSSADTTAKDSASTGLPHKYLSYTSHDSPASNCSNSDPLGQLSPKPSSDPVSRHRLGTPSSRSSSRDDLRHLRSDLLANGISAEVDFLSGVADKHDDGLSLVSETEFVVMRSGDIVKRPIRKSERSNARVQNRYSKSTGYTSNLLR